MSHINLNLTKEQKKLLTDKQKWRLYKSRMQRRIRNGEFIKVKFHRN